MELEREQERQGGRAREGRKVELEREGQGREVELGREGGGREVELRRQKKGKGVQLYCIGTQALW